ncbi:hypothetical protein JAAARDRAFT_187671 [Jaapia argillacea MUCL 33604]|uniref:DUF6697 domain-containing protein n=1 Tax=Jaapia argillacea MUCL 33604 TaxID=933084 RepID=A0A067QLC2_9AGAM|nr:hypothetical protein JAAARDRAFT_187671 [Jaapia argillacea MUCL 33604]
MPVTHATSFPARHLRGHFATILLPSQSISSLRISQPTAFQGVDSQDAPPSFPDTPSVAVNSSSCQANVGDRRDPPSGSSPAASPSNLVNMLGSTDRDPSQAMISPTFSTGSQDLRRLPVVDTDRQSSHTKRKFSAIADDDAVKSDPKLKRMTFPSLRKSASLFVKKLVGQFRTSPERHELPTPGLTSSREHFTSKESVVTTPHDEINSGQLLPPPVIPDPNPAETSIPVIAVPQTRGFSRPFHFTRSSQGSVATFQIGSVRRRLHDGEWFPLAPGDDGRLVSAAPNAICGDRIFALIRGETYTAEGRKFYYGHYSSSIQPLPRHQFRELATGLKTTLAREVLVSGHADHALIRSRIGMQLSRNGARQLKNKAMAGSSKLPSLADAPGNLVTLALDDVLVAFESGEEHVCVVDLEFKSFDRDFEAFVLRELKN